MVVVASDEVGDGVADLGGIAEDAAVDGLLLEGAVEAFGDAVGLRLLDEGEAGRDAPVPDLVQEVIGEVLRSVILGRPRFSWTLKRRR